MWYLKAPTRANSGPKDWKNKWVWRIMGRLMFLVKIKGWYYSFYRYRIADRQVAAFRLPNSSYP